MKTTSRRRFGRTRRRFLCPALVALLLIVALPGMPVAYGQGATPVAEADLTTAIDLLIPNDGGVYGVVVFDPAAGMRYSRNATVPFVSASLYKLPLMAHVFALAERGALNLSDAVYLDGYFWSEGEDSYYDWSWTGAHTTVEELLFAAGAYSSNVAAWALATLITWPEVQETARAIGMIDTHMLVTTPMLDAWPPVAGESDSPEALATAVDFIDAMYGWSPVMITTPRDIATFFAGLLAGRVVSVRASWAMIDILARQVVTDRFPSLLPERVWLAHKTGNLSQVIHDAGIIYAATGPVILVGMVAATPDEWTAIVTLRQLALTVFEAYRPAA